MIRRELHALEGLGAGVAGAGGALPAEHDAAVPDVRDDQLLALGSETGASSARGTFVLHGLIEMKSVCACICVRACVRKAGGREDHQDGDGGGRSARLLLGRLHLQAAVRQQGLVGPPKCGPERLRQPGAVGAPAAA